MVTLASLEAEWLADLKPNTRVAYKNGLALYRKWAASTDDPRLFAAQYHEHRKDWRAWLLTDRGYSTASVVVRDFAILTFTKWLHKKGLADPPVKVKLPRDRIESPSIVDDARVDYIIDTGLLLHDKQVRHVIKDEGRPLLDAAIVAASYYGMVKSSEATDLLVQDYHVYGNLSLADRDVPLPPKAQEAMRTYIDEDRSLYARTGALFVNTRGGAISRAWFHQSCVIAGKWVGIEGCSPAALRRSRALNLLDAGASLTDIAVLMGTSRGHIYGRIAYQQK